MEAPVGLQSELDLFVGDPMQLGIDHSSFIEIHPLSSLAENGPIEFYINGNGQHYLDLSHTILSLKIKIKKKTGGQLGDTDIVGPVNYILNTMFSECSVFLNEKQIASQSNYCYRAILESLLFYSKSAQESMLSAAGFYKDTAGAMNEIGANSGNEGLKTRTQLYKNSNLVELIGPLHFDLATQNKLLINGVSVRIKLERNKNAFVLMSATDTYDLLIQSASLYVRKIIVAPSVMLGHEKALELGVIKMPIRRVEVKTFALSAGLQSTTISNAYIGDLPARIIIGLVSNDALNGSANKNPFHFTHNNLEYICILSDNQMIPAKPYQPDFEKSLYARNYLSLFTDLNRYHSSPNINIQYVEYRKGYTLHAFDLTPDLASAGNHTSINKTGNIAIDIRFGDALPETTSVICYAEYRNTIEIDKARSVYTDF